MLPVLSGCQGPSRRSRSGISENLPSAKIMCSAASRVDRTTSYLAFHIAQLVQSAGKPMVFRRRAARLRHPQGTFEESLTHFGGGVDVNRPGLTVLRGTIKACLRLRPSGEKGPNFKGDWWARRVCCSQAALNDSRMRRASFTGRARRSAGSSGVTLILLATRASTTKIPS